MSTPDNVSGLERLMRDVLHDISANWTEQEVIHARDDIYYGEFSLGAELFAATISRGKKPLTADSFNRIVELFYMLDISDSEYLKELRDYAASLGIDQSAAGGSRPSPDPSP